MIWRVRTPAQIDHVVAVGRRFHAASIWSATEYAEADVQALVTSLVDGAGAVFASARGICGAILSPLWFNRSVPVAVELFWYAEDGTGGRLREAVEIWAASAGATYVQISGLADEREGALRRLLARSGHEAKEIAFMKRVERVGG